jgi:hypothetical protein
MTRPGHALLVAAVLLAFHPAGARSVSGGDPINQIERSVTKPLPSVGPQPAPRQDRIWVPGRQVRTPDGGVVTVPGHWERPQPSTGDRYVPPLVVCSQDGQCTTTPAGTRPPPELRGQTP